MNTIVYQLDADGDHRDAIRQAAQCLADGGLVVFPTETVYGLGANAADPRAVARLRQVKHRTQQKPFTVHIGSRWQVERFVPRLDGLARRLIVKAWPGPLTLIFSVPDFQTAPILSQTAVEHAPAMYHDGQVGIRCPDDRVAADLLNQAGVPVIAASANPAGAPAPVEAGEALASLDGQVDLVLDAGRTRYAKPSTIVRLDQDGYHLVREGVIDERTIRRLACLNFLLVCTGNTCRSPMAAGLLRRLLAERLACREDEIEARGYHIESAGTGSFAGAGPSAGAVHAMNTRGIDITAHYSQPLALDLINRADHILAMTAAHAETVARTAPEARDRTRRVEDHDIEDPMGGDDAVYDRCADRIERALRQRLKEISL